MKIPISIVIILCSQLSAIGIASILPKEKYIKYIKYNNLSRL